MVAHIAVGVDTAQARTRVLALSVDAGLVRWTVRVDHTLWPAVGRRANHLWQAGALALAIKLSGRVRIWTTRVGDAWILFNNRLNS